MLVSLTVGKVDAGVAVLLTQDNRLVSSNPWSPAPYSPDIDDLNFCRTSIANKYALLTIFRAD
jgi:hypothetical protein